MDTFDRFAPFIQDFIYQNSWESLRGIQVAAADGIFNTDEHLLLCSSTASGKTEAAFFPVLTLFKEEMPESVGAIYIAPLKALINDQFLRLKDLCREADIPVWHWHGDVSQSHKEKLMKRPSGILQITPESLEAMLLRRHSYIPKLFGDLRFIVIDELHSLMRGDRGGQTICLIQRLEALSGTRPRRIGLSATIGDPEAAGRFLASGTDRGVFIPKIRTQPAKWRISMEHFYKLGEQAGDGGDAGGAAVSDGAGGRGEGDVVQVPAHSSEVARVRTGAGAEIGTGQDAGSEIGTREAGAEIGTREAGAEIGTCQEAGAEIGTGQDAGAEIGTGQEAGADIGTRKQKLPVPDGGTAPAGADPGIAYIYNNTRGRKCLVFVNSREECEEITTSLRRCCEEKHQPDRFLIHHGNLSTAYRESAEAVMKDEEQFQTTVTTSTLELGIDIGRLERAFQIDAPFTVSSFLQRMGRTGRREMPPEMWFVIREEHVEPRAMLPLTIPWKLLQGIALVQVYREEKFVEPPSLYKMPYSLLYHQTMSILASSGELSPGALASKVLTLSVFRKISQEDYKILLRHLLEIDHIQRTEKGGLIVGLAGERITNSFKFYAVFKEDEEYTVRSPEGELGTIVQPPPAGEKIAIAGHVWIVEEVDRKRHLVMCSMVKGQVPAYFGQCPGDINTHILERMRLVLKEQESYPYVMKNAKARLAEARRSAVSSGMTEEPLLCLGGDMWVLFPWLGTYAFLALERLLRIKCAARLGLANFDSSRSYFMQFRMDVSKEEFYRIVKEAAASDFDPIELVYDGEVPVFEKYDEFVPPELIRKGFANGVLDIDTMKKRVAAWPGSRVETPEDM